MSSSAAAAFPTDIEGYTPEMIEYLTNSWYYYDVCFAKYIGYIDGHMVRQCVIAGGLLHFEPASNVCVDGEERLREGAKPVRFRPLDSQWNLTTCRQAVDAIIDYVKSLRYSELHLNWVRHVEGIPIPTVRGLNQAMGDVASPRITSGQCAVCHQDTPFTLTCFWSHYCCNACLKTIIKNATRRREHPRCPHCRSACRTLKYAYNPDPTLIDLTLTSPVPAAVRAAEEMVQLAPPANTTQEDDDDDDGDGDDAESSSSDESVQVVEEPSTSIRSMMQEGGRRVRRRMNLD